MIFFISLLTLIRIVFEYSNTSVAEYSNPFSQRIPAQELNSSIVIATRLATVNLDTPLCRADPSWPERSRANTSRPEPGFLSTPPIQRRPVPAASLRRSSDNFAGTKATETRHQSETKAVDVTCHSEARLPRSVTGRYVHCAVFTLAVSLVWMELVQNFPRIYQTDRIAPDPSGGDYMAPYTPARFKGAYILLNGGETIEKREEGGKKKGPGKGRGKWRERGIPALVFPHFKPWKVKTCHIYFHGVF